MVFIKCFETNTSWLKQILQIFQGLPWNDIAYISVYFMYFVMHHMCVYVALKVD